MNMISKGFIIAGFTVCVAGCRSGLYEIETSENAPATSHLQYRIVDKLDPEKYSTEFLPVEVKVEKKKGSDDSGGLCCLTLGIIPAFYDEFETYTITVNTPIGSKSANATLHAKSWIGWICLIPYPASGDERDGNPTLPNEQLEAKLKDRVVESLIAKFSADEYAGFIKKLNDQRSAEENRVKEKCRKIDSQLAKGEFESVIKACEEEMASTKKDAPWKELKERAIKEMTDAIDTTTDEKRLVALFDMMTDCEVKNKIILRLDAMNKVGALPSEVLYKIVSESQDTKIKVAAVHGISEPNKLLKIATEKHDKEVAAIAYSQLNGEDAANKIVVELCAMKMCDSGKKVAPFYLDHINIEKVFEIVDNIPVDTLRSAVSAKLLDTLLSDKTLKIDWIDCEHGNARIREFCSHITEDDADKFFDRIEYDSIEHSESFIVGLAKQLPEIVIKKRAYDIKEKARETVSFAGYYCGMTVQEFYIMCLRNGMTWEEIGKWREFRSFSGSKRVDFSDGHLCYIVFSRSLRYKLFEKEEGEFWSEYMHTFVPSKKRDLAKTIESVIDDSIYDYQHTFIAGWNEGGYVYRSNKYKTKVCFGQKSGRLLLSVLGDGN